MLWMIVAFMAGLIVGWNFLPQPKWIADFFVGW
jgi:hypothetical protein